VGAFSFRLLTLGYDEKDSHYPTIYIFHQIAPEERYRKNLHHCPSRFASSFLISFSVVLINQFSRNVEHVEISGFRLSLVYEWYPVTG